jgi:DNA polymerase III subunit beta
MGQVELGEAPTGADYPPIEFTAYRIVLDKLTEWVSAVLPKKVVSPVLGCIRITVAPEEISFVATDMERTVYAVSQAISTSSTGTFFIPGQRFKSILTEAPDGNVTVRVKGSYAEVQAGEPSWNVRLPGPANYARLTDISGAELSPVSRESFLGALKTVRYAVSRDTSQPGGAQVHVAESAGTMYATACSGGRYCRAPVTGFPFETSIPAGVLDDLIKMLSSSVLDDVLVGVAERSLVFRAGPVTLVELPLDQRFPDMDRLVLAPAQANKDELGVDRRELSVALKRVRINADSTTSAVALVLIDDHLTVEAKDENNNTASETITASWRGGERLLVVNAQFMLDMLGAHPATTCTFRVGTDQGKRRAALLLEDAESGVTGVIPQMQPALVGR